MIAMMMALKIVIKSIDSFLFVFLHQGKKVSGVIEAKPLFNSVVHYADNHIRFYLHFILKIQIKTKIVTYS
jgi:hypothetical protein